MSCALEPECTTHGKLSLARVVHSDVDARAALCTENGCSAQLCTGVGVHNARVFWREPPLCTGNDLCGEKRAGRSGPRDRSGRAGRAPRSHTPRRPVGAPFFSQRNVCLRRASRLRPCQTYEIDPRNVGLRRARRGRPSHSNVERPRVGTARRRVERLRNRRRGHGALDAGMVHPPAREEPGPHAGVRAPIKVLVKRIIGRSGGHLRRWGQATCRQMIRRAATAPSRARGPGALETPGRM